MMGRGGGRDRINSDYMPRMEEKERRTGWGVAPPSRHLWVGNLSPHVSQNTLYEHFLRFGDIDSIAYMPGRSYAFVNYKREDDAVIALRALQGFIVAGNSLRVEFAKGDRDSESSLDDEYSQLNNGRYANERDDPLLRAPRQSPEKPNEKSKGSKITEPSEVLWIGFPAFLNVEEEDLRRAFLPFGEIENISAFPGRSYAFVRYRSIVAACRAKEALQGKLFNNPRVHICFAKSDLPSYDYGKSSSNAPFPPNLKPNFQLGLSNSEPSQLGRGFDGHIGDFSTSPRDAGFLRRSDSSFIGLGGNNFTRSGAGPGSILSGNIEKNRLHDLSSERRISEELYERYRNSPAGERSGWSHDVPFERRQRTPPVDDSWGMEDGTFPSAKKARLDSFSDKELPEYPFSDTEQGKHDIGRRKFSPSLPYNIAYNKGFESGIFDHKGAPQSLRTMNDPLADGDESWRVFDNLSTGPGSLPFSMTRMQRPSPESHQPPRILEWKWEGTIAKGSTPVCRARCFPVGKVLDFMLPEFLNCTARTGLDMLAKHYYQATSSWVVFFVPETDADMSSYNEFMHYLGEKQRAAVAKLGEKITLFLVPPSEFSEQVLKVPGKMSISGVILKFQQPDSNFSSLHHSLEITEPKLPHLLPPPDDHVNLHEDRSFTKPRSPDFRAFSQSQNYFNSSSGPLPPPPPPPPPPPTFLPQQKQSDKLPYSGSMHLMEKLPDYQVESRHDQPHLPVPATSSNWSNQMLIPSSNIGNFTVSHLTSNSTGEAHPLGNHKVTQGSIMNNYVPETPGVPLHTGRFPTREEIKPQVSPDSATPLQPAQLAQLAVLLGQHKQSGKEPSIASEGMNKQANLLQIANSHAPAPVIHAQSIDLHAQNPVTHGYSSIPSSSLGSQLNQVHQYQQQPSNVPAVQPVLNSGQQNQQQADMEADPQKRLQATLQLAAVLLQQIQQQSKPADQR